MTDFDDTFDTSTKQLKILKENGGKAKGQYLRIGEESPTGAGEDLIYAKLLEPPFYLSVIAHQKVLEHIKATRSISSSFDSLRVLLQAWYLSALIDHFLEQGMIIEEYYKAIESLWALFQASELEGEVKKRVIKILFKVHVRPDFVHSSVQADVTEWRVHTLVFEKAKPAGLRKELGTKECLDAQRWFLARYDTKRARVVRTVMSEESAAADSELNFKRLKETESTRWLFMNLLLLLCFFLAYGITGPWLGFTESQEIREFIILAYRWVSGLALYALPLTWIVVNLRRKGMLWYQNLLPRLLCGIIIGYIFLLNNDAWEGSTVLLKLDFEKLDQWATAFVRFVLPLALSFGYLFIEINNNIKGKRGASKFSLRRAGSILLQGMFYSWFLGVVFSDLFGTAMLSHFAEKGQMLCLKGPLGDIYPMSILMLFPLALFIGIFTQIIWEDKAITHPI